MKKISFITICFMFFSTLIFAQESEKLVASNGNTILSAEFDWAGKQTIDMGKIEKGKPVTVTFEFTNNGDVPLVISSAKGQCGCTSVEYSQEAVAPHHKGFVKATYNAASLGYFNKSITVNANTSESQVQLGITGEVL